MEFAKMEYKMLSEEETQAAFGTVTRLAESTEAQLERAIYRILRQRMEPKLRELSRQYARELQEKLETLA